MRTTTLFAGAFFACHALCGCDDTPAAFAEVTQLTTMPLGGAIDGDQITLTEGTAMGIRIVVMDDERYILPEGTGWRVDGGAATLVKLTTSEAYVVGGVQVGTARLVSDEGLLFDVTVTAQPAF